MRRFGALLALAFLVSACEREEHIPPATETPAGVQGEAQPAPHTDMGAGVGARVPEGGVVVELIDRNGERVGGARLEAEGEGVRISIRVSGLTQGVHGLHFHQNGECQPPTFESAGGHFNPQGTQHGFENPQGPHAGDLPNLNADAEGVADTTFVATNVRLDGSSQNGLLRGGGTALVVHARRDDYRTDPSGDSGDRIACGVVRGN